MTVKIRTFNMDCAGQYSNLTYHGIIDIKDTSFEDFYLKLKKQMKLASDEWYECYCDILVPDKVATISSKEIGLCAEILTTGELETDEPDDHGFESLPDGVKILRYGAGDDEETKQFAAILAKVVAKL